MKNPLTFRIESWVGAVLVLGFSAFFVGLFVVALQNYSSDLDILNSSGAKVRTISPQEKALIDKWLTKSDIGISVQEVGYRYILQNFPNRPWLTEK